MTKAPLFLVVVLAGCMDSPTPLSQVQSARLEILASDQLTIYMHVDTDGGCPTLGDDVVARYQGQEMNSQRGIDYDATGCYPVAFWGQPQAAAPSQGIARTTGALQIADHSTTWNVDPGMLYADDFADDTANSQIIWTDVPKIETASLWPSVPITIDNNVIHYPKGTQIEWVSATADFVAPRCEGPAQCVVQTAGEGSPGPIKP